MCSLHSVPRRSEKAVSEPIAYCIRCDKHGAQNKMLWLLRRIDIDPGHPYGGEPMLWVHHHCLDTHLHLSSKEMGMATERLQSEIVVYPGPYAVLSAFA